MNTLKRNTEIEPEKFLNLLRNNELIVYEEVQGSKIWVNYVNDNWVIRPKAVNQNPINMIDMAMQKYYKYAYQYLLNLPDEVTNLLRPNYYFCFEYFPDEQPANIKYDRIPKNHLILTCICKYGKNYVYNVDELKTWADLFDVDTLPIMYRGRLMEKQLDAINYFLHTSEKDIQLFFKDISFTEFFYKLLNPATSASFLKNNTFNDNLQKIVMRYGKDQETTLEILNPIYQKMQLKTDSEFSDVYSLLLFNFMQWLLTIDLNTVESSGTSREIIYINLISKLFNMYCNKYEQNIIDFSFTVPEFFNSDKFRVNQGLIKNQTTIELLNKHSKLEYLFKILLSNFQREQKKQIGIINEIALEHLNNLIRKIQIKIEEQLNYNTNIDRYSFKYHDLNNYPNIKWEQDHKGHVMTDMGSLFPDNNDTDKKKMKKK